TGGAWNISNTRGQCFENGIEMLHGISWATDHHAIAALQTPHTATGADIDVADAASKQILRAANVVNVIRIASIDNNVVFIELGNQAGQCLIDTTRGNHQPHRAGLGKLGEKLVERMSRRGPFFAQSIRCRWIDVVDNALMSTFHEPANHVRAHPSQTDHSEL